jgi:hypothetical protein
LVLNLTLSSNINYAIDVDGWFWLSSNIMDFLKEETFVQKAVVS